MDANLDRDSISLWMGTADTPRFAPLAGDTQCDVCIVGAGLAGLTTAYLLLLSPITAVVTGQADLVGTSSALLFGDDGSGHAGRGHRFRRTLRDAHF